MLWELDIENVAVISKAHISFTNGFNVFTGETGAGKSILLEAIGAVLGNRTSKEIIRTGETKAKVTALFGSLSDDTVDFLKNIGFEISDNEVVISREITADRSICHVNGVISTVAMLKNIGKLLVDVHGQKDNYVLADPESHINFIDSFANNSDMLKEYSLSYENYRDISKKLEEMSLDEREKKLKLDELEYQINDITSAELKIDEESDLLLRKNKIKNSKLLISALSEAKILISGDDESDGIISMLEKAEGCLGDSSEYISEMDSVQKRITDIRYELDEFSETIKQNLDDLSYDENELENIEERLDLIFRLKNKYGNTIEEISNYLAKAQKEFKIYSDNSEAIRLLNDELAAAENKTKLLAEKLTKNREKASLRFCNMVAAELKMLSMPNVRLDIPIKKTLLSKKGADYLEIFISVNSGEEMRPLAKVASGGEMSRIMLAIKNVISAEDDVATQIFDEIDTGISGIAAQKVGRKLYEVSRGRQVICVTHLAQVASYADNHLLIEKNNIENRTFTEVKTLNHDNRISEIARIISGEPISKIALAGAEELLNNAAKEKTKMLNKQLALEK